MTALQPSSAKTFFDWIRPSLIAGGLIVPAPWQGEHALLAAAEFTDPRLQRTAVILAALHPAILDYIAQAPVLVLPHATNMAFTHEVPAFKRQTGRRISVTIRAFAAPDPLTHKSPR